MLQGLLRSAAACRTPVPACSAPRWRMDKIRTKQVWLSLGLPTPRYVRLAPGRRRACRRARARPAGDRQAVAAKAPASASSRVFDDADLDAAVELAARYPGELLMEQLIDGDELTVGDPRRRMALPSIRIVPDGRVVRLPRQVRRRRHAVPVPGPGRRRRRRDPPPRARRVPRGRLQRLGPRRRDARPRQRRASTCSK